MKDQNPRDKLARGLLIGSFILIIIYRGCGSCSHSNIQYDNTPETISNQSIDTTSAQYIFDKLSKKKKLTETERRELREAKEGLENIRLENEAEENVKIVRKIREDFQENHMSGWDGSCPNLVKYIKSNLDDPESFEHVSTYYAPDLQHDCMVLSMQFRAKNRFGALVLSSVDARVAYDGTVLRVTQSN